MTVGTTAAHSAMLRMIAQADEIYDGLVAQGLPLVASDCAKAMLRTTLLQLADMQAAGTTMASCLSAYQNAFAQAISTLVVTLAGDSDTAPMMAAEFLDRLNEQTLNTVLDPTPLTIEPVNRVLS